MYADDVKIFRKITSPSDSQEIQRDLDRLTAWSACWGLSLNPSKCKSFTMTLRRAPVQITYNIGGTVLEHVDQIRDLGIIIDSKLTFAQHVDHAVKRANRALGLLMRSFQTGARPGKFRTSAVLTACFANVRSILEYGSVIWAGAAETHTARIDRVQHKFLMWLLSYTLSGYAPSLSYENLLHHFRLPSLSSRRMQHDIIFIRNIFRLNFDCADLLASFALHIPTRSTRAYKLFNEPRARVNTIQSSLFCRLPRVANSFLNKCNRVDVFNDTFHAFKRAVIRYVNEMWLAMRWPTNFSIYPTSPISGVFPVGDWMNKWKWKWKWEFQWGMKVIKIFKEFVECIKPVCPDTNTKEQLPEVAKRCAASSVFLSMRLQSCLLFILLVVLIV